jgi:TolB-like protein
MVPQPGSIRRFLSELKRRRVFRVAIAYAAVAFVALQTADLIFPPLDLPAWTLTFLVVVALLGFPVAIVMAWAFDLTPDGVRRAGAAASGTSGAATNPSGPASAAVPAPATRRRSAAWLALGLLVAGSAGWYGVSRLGTDRLDGGDAVDAAVVAVVPFRVAGADPGIAYLREGMVDLLAAKLTGEAGPRAVDPRTLLSAWRRAVRDDSGDLTPDEAAELGRRLGAGLVVLGEAVSAPGRLILTASTVDARTGRAGRPVTVEGPPDSLPALVDGLTAGVLTLEAGEGDHRVASLMSTSLPALRAYLRARSDYRLARFEAALDGFVAALGHDSTFAVAAIAADRAAGWLFPGPLERADWLAMAERHAQRLSVRDRAVLEAVVDAHGALATPRGRLAAWERVARQSPDDAEAWYELGDILFHDERLLGDDALARAAEAFERAYRLDPSFSPARIHVFDAAMRRGDLEGRIHVAREHLAEDSTSVHATYLRMGVRIVDGWDPDAIWEAERNANPEAAIGTVALILSEPIVDPRWEEPILRLADHAAARPPAGARSAGERVYAWELRRHYARNRGRSARAEAALREIAALTHDPYLVPRVQILDALYWDGDPDQGRRGAARLEEAMVRAGGAVALAATTHGRDALCALGQWRLAREDTREVAGTAAALRSAAAAGDASDPAAASLCADLLDSWTAHITGHPEAREWAGRLDRSLGELSLARSPWLEANLILARILEEQGDLFGAYAAARRQAWYPGVDIYLSTYLREQARLADRAGNQQAAARAYARYLALHRDAEPGPAADAAAAARLALAALAAPR